MSKIVLDKILRKFPDDIIDSHNYLGNETVIIKKEALLKVCAFIKENRQLVMDMLVDLTCVDYPEEPERFMMVYHFYSSENKYRIRIKSPVSEEEPYIDSLTKLWINSDWAEREVYDMYGVKFNDHPNLSRILMYDGFEGHPLRKDYPITKRQPIVGPLN
jgi:NADH-quinone oxidoreductase subunit C